MCLVENREAEQSDDNRKMIVAEHVWQTCRPPAQMTSTSSTVPAGRALAMRFRLQNEPEAVPDDPNPCDCKSIVKVNLD